jgi:hypothetical protein
MLESNHSTFYVQRFLVSFLYKFLVFLSFYVKHVENSYFPLLSKFNVLMWLLASFFIQSVGAPPNLLLFFLCNLFLKLNFLIQFSNISLVGKVVLDAIELNTPPKNFKKKKRMERHTKKRLHIFFDESKKTSQDGKICRNCRTSLIMRHTLIGASFLGNFNIIAIGYIAMQTRLICIIAYGPFSRISVCRCANTSTTPHLMNATNAPSPLQECYMPR